MPRMGKTLGVVKCSWSTLSRRRTRTAMFTTIKAESKSTTVVELRVLRASSLRPTVTISARATREVKTMEIQGVRRFGWTVEKTLGKRPGEGGNGKDPARPLPPPAQVHGAGKAERRRKRDTRPGGAGVDHRN